MKEFNKFAAKKYIVLDDSGKVDFKNISIDENGIKTYNFVPINHRNGKICVNYANGKHKNFDACADSISVSYNNGEIVVKDSCINGFRKPISDFTIEDDSSAEEYQFFVHEDDITTYTFEFVDGHELLKKDETLITWSDGICSTDGAGIDMFSQEKFYSENTKPTMYAKVPNNFKITDGVLNIKFYSLEDKNKEDMIKYYETNSKLKKDECNYKTKMLNKFSYLK